MGTFLKPHTPSHLALLICLMKAPGLREAGMEGRAAATQRTVHSCSRGSCHRRWRLLSTQHTRAWGRRMAHHVLGPPSGAQCAVVDSVGRSSQERPAEAHTVASQEPGICGTATSRRRMQLREQEGLVCPQTRPPVVLPFTRFR